MSTRIYKYIFTVLLFTITFFAGTNGIDAAESCTCYYKALHEESSGAEGTTTYSTDEAIVGITYSASSADVTFSCLVSSSTTYVLGSNAGGADISCPDGSDGKIQRGSAADGKPFDVDSGYIAENDCSESACNSANLYLWYGALGKTFVVTKTDGYKAPIGGYVESFSWTDSEVAMDIATNGIGDNKDTTYSYSSISEWADPNNGDSDSLYSDTSGGTSGCDLIGEELMDLLNDIFLVGCVAGILILIIMTAIDFIKAITGSDEDTLKKATKHLTTRLACVVILLLLPTIVSWLLNFVNDFNDTHTIGDDGNPICRI